MAEDVAPAAEAVTRPDDQEMSFFEHLGELRTRLIYSIVGWGLASVVTWYFTEYIIKWLRQLIGNTELIYTKPTEAFFVYFKVALVGGFFLALPWILYQIIVFVRPGLEPDERKWILRIVPAACLLFVAGVSFAYFALLPMALKFFLGFQTQDLRAMITISEYISFVVFLLLACGLVFQTPIVLVVAAVLGLVKSQQLRQWRRYAIVSCFIIAALVAPTPDAFTQTMVAIPMILLYEISIWVIRAIGR
jgi:sec-independent protein translocase protein TatC